MSPYQDQVIVVNDNNNNKEVVVTTSKQKKNILYSGIIFIAIVGTTLMIPRYRDPKKVGTWDEGSLTNLHSATTTECPPCHFPASITINHSICQQVCYRTAAKQYERTPGGWNNDWCAGTYVSYSKVTTGHGEMSLACIFITPNFCSSISDNKL